MKLVSMRHFSEIHKGQRCFMVGAGPSLTYEMLDAIKDEVSFSMNNIAITFPYTSWRPYYYLNVSFTSSWSKHWVEYANLATAAATHSFFWPHNLHIPLAVNPRFFTVVNAVSVPMWSYDIHEWVSRYGSSMFAALQLAVFMGCNPIYLLGCDMGYDDSINLATGEDGGHFDKDYLGKDKIDWIVGRGGLSVTKDEARTYSSHQMAYMHAMAKGITIKTCSPGPTQKIYPFIPFEEALHEVFPVR